VRALFQSESKLNPILWLLAGSAVAPRRGQTTKTGLVSAPIEALNCKLKSGRSRFYCICLTWVRVYQCRTVQGLLVKFVHLQLLFADSRAVFADHLVHRVCKLLELGWVSKIWPHSVAAPVLTRSISKFDGHLYWGIKIRRHSLDRQLGSHRSTREVPLQSIRIALTSQTTY
jgi:hypothetical protein